MKDEVCSIMRLDPSQHVKQGELESWDFSEHMLFDFSDATYYIQCEKGDWKGLSFDTGEARGLNSKKVHQFYDYHAKSYGGLFIQVGEAIDDFDAEWSSVLEGKYLTFYPNAAYFERRGVRSPGWKDFSVYTGYSDDWAKPYHCKSWNIIRKCPRMTSDLVCLFLVSDNVDESGIIQSLRRRGLDRIKKVKRDYIQPFYYCVVEENGSDVEKPISYMFRYVLWEDLKRISQSEDDAD